MKTRGYVMFEVMIGGALLALLLATLLDQIADARTRNIVAGRDIIAAQLVQQKLSAQRSRGFTNVDAGCAAGEQVGGQIGNYTRDCVAGVATAQTINGVGVQFKDLSVTVTYTPAPKSPPRIITALSRVYE